MKTLLKSLLGLSLNSLMGGTFAMMLGVSPTVGAGIGCVLGLVLGMLPAVAGVRAGVMTEIYTGELVKALRGGLEGTFLDGISDQSTLVQGNDVIHLVDVGVDPEVLINNTSYPIPLQALEDKDIPVSLDKFQTKVTPITDDELYAISYDKMQRVKEAHANALLDAKMVKAAHALTPQTNTEKTPVLATTGAFDNGSRGRRRMTISDIVALKAAMDKLGVPASDRRLVLCSDHVNDLLLTAQQFREQYYKTENGTISRLYGFDIYEFGNCPLFTTAGAKRAVGSIPTTGEFQGSFAFYTKRVFKASGSVKMYYSAASTDPEYQRNKVAFTERFICMPTKQDAAVAIYSPYQA